MDGFSFDQPPSSEPSGESHHDQICSSGGAGRRCYPGRDAGRCAAGAGAGQPEGQCSRPHPQAAGVARHAGPACSATSSSARSPARRPLRSRSCDGQPDGLHQRPDLLGHGRSARSTISRVQRCDRRPLLRHQAGPSKCQHRHLAVHAEPTRTRSTLINSGNPGTNFFVGGAITVRHQHSRGSVLG